MKSLFKKIEPEEEIIYQVSNSTRAGVELLVGLLVAIIYFGIFQYDEIISLDIFLKFALVMGNLIIFLFML